MLVKRHIPPPELLRKDEELELLHSYALVFHAWLGWRLAAPYSSHSVVGDTPNYTRTVPIFLRCLQEHRVSATERQRGLVWIWSSPELPPQLVQSSNLRALD